MKWANGRFWISIREGFTFCSQVDRMVSKKTLRGYDTYEKEMDDRGNSDISYLEPDRMPKE